jgi:hypothetical protein
MYFRHLFNIKSDFKYVQSQLNALLIQISENHKLTDTKIRSIQTFEELTLKDFYDQDNTISFLTGTTGF